jgi:hypothetical protein
MKRREFLKMVGLAGLVGGCLPRAKMKTVVDWVACPPVGLGEDGTVIAEWAVFSDDPPRGTLIARHYFGEERIKGAEKQFGVTWKIEQAEEDDGAYLVG